MDSIALRRRTSVVHRRLDPANTMMTRSFEDIPAYISFVCEVLFLVYDDLL